MADIAENLSVVANGTSSSQSVPEEPSTEISTSNNRKPEKRERRLVPKDESKAEASQRRKLITMGRTHQRREERLEARKAIIENRQKLYDDVLSGRVAPPEGTKEEWLKKHKKGLRKGVNKLKRHQKRHKQRGSNLADAQILAPEFNKLVSKASRSRPIRKQREAGKEGKKEGVDESEGQTAEPANEGNGGEVMAVED